MPAETLANAFSQHIRQDSKEGRKQEENAREQGVTTAQKLQDRKILEQQEELRRQKEQTKLLLDLKHTTQVLELQVAAVKSVALSTLYAFKHTSPPSCFAVLRCDFKSWWHRNRDSKLECAGAVRGGDRHENARCCTPWA